MIILQADDWNINTLDASRSLSANTFVCNSHDMFFSLSFFLFSFFFFSFFFLGLTDLQMQGFGSLMAVPFAQRYGTYVVLDLLAMLASSQLTGCSA